MGSCTICGSTAYVLIDGHCGECLLAVNGTWPEAPAPVHEPVYDEVRGSARYLPGFVQARDAAARQAAAFARAKR